MIVPKVVKPTFLGVSPQRVQNKSCHRDDAASLTASEAFNIRAVDRRAERGALVMPEGPVPQVCPACRAQPAGSRTTTWASVRRSSTLSRHPLP